MFNDLEELENILDLLVFDEILEEEEEDFFINEEIELDFVEAALYLLNDYMNENPTAISEQDFEEIILEELQDLFYLQFEDFILNNDYVEDDINDLLKDAVIIFLSTFGLERSHPQPLEKVDPNFQPLEKVDPNFQPLEKVDLNFQPLEKVDLNLEKVEKIKYLKSKPQPQQRTSEWYQFRYNLITASNAYKAFESQATQNQLIYEKCKPLITINTENENKMVNTNTTLHWGQKFEPLSVLIYEHLYNTKVDDFGCIQHDKYSFLGASPDGINVDLNSNIYGRMLEIKNIVNREITGIPKKEYWIQTQLQMEVCDLDECDFLETKFTEYIDYLTFVNDELKKEEMKGVIMYFNTKDSKPFYIYKPLNITDYNEISIWEEEMVDVYQSKNMIWVKNIYWKLEKLSCVLILRNKKWFQDNIEQLGNIWKIIEHERITGYEHRAPKKRIKKLSENNTDIKNEGCLLNIDILTGKTNLNI